MLAWAAAPAATHSVAGCSSPAARLVWVPSRRSRRAQLSKCTSIQAPRATECAQQQDQPRKRAQAGSSGCTSSSTTSSGGFVTDPAAAAAVDVQCGALAAAAAATAQQQQQQQQQPAQQQVPAMPATGSSSSSMPACDAEQPPEIGVAPHVDLEQLASGKQQQRPRRGASPAAPAAPAPPDPAAATAAAGAAAAGSSATADAGLLYPPSERTQIRNSWNSLMRWARYFRCARLKMSRGSVRRARFNCANAASAAHSGNAEHLSMILPNISRQTAAGPWHDASSHLAVVCLHDAGRERRLTRCTWTRWWCLVAGALARPWEWRLRGSGRTSR